MAYLANYDWDLFVSYAHREETDFPKDWIKGFEKDLVAAVERGLSKSMKVFFDHREQKTYNTIESILSAVRKSAMLVIFATPNWMKSDWGVRELRTFLETRQDTTRVVIAELHPPEGEITWPDIVPNNLYLKFYRLNGDRSVPLPLKRTEKDYLVNKDSLARDIRDRLLELGRIQGERTPLVDQKTGATDITSNGTHIVALAHCTPDVADEREQVYNYLLSKRVTVLSLPAPGDLEEGDYRAQCTALLNRATVFVQLLGFRKALREPLSRSSTLLQREWATEAGLQAFVWRPDEIDPDRVPDEDYRDLLLTARNGSAVPDLALDVINRLETIQLRVEQPTGPAVQGAKTLPIILVSADPEDREFASDLVQACDEKACMAFLDDSPVIELARQDWAAANAIAFVQGGASSRWLTSRLIAVNRERANAGVPLALLGQTAVYAPPPPKRVGAVGGNGIKELDMSERWEPSRFALWVNQVVEDWQGGAGA
jgi:hypothetical protein